MPYIRTNGIRFAFDTFGDMKKKPIFLVHGLTGQRMQMYDTAEALKDDYFVITYDCRGHGQTDHPASYTLEDHGRDLLALIDAFGYEKAYILGASMGSYVSMQAAELGPSKVEKLILVTTKAFDDGSGSSVDRVLREKGLKLGEASEEEMMAAVNSALWSPEMSMEKAQEILAKQLDMGPNTVTLTPEETNAVNQALVGFDLRPGLSKITCPTLIVAGEYDGINPPSFSRMIVQDIPNAELRIFPSGHNLAAECADDYHAAIKEFLAK